MGSTRYLHVATAPEAFAVADLGVAERLALSRSRLVAIEVMIDPVGTFAVSALDHRLAKLRFALGRSEDIRDLAIVGDAGSLSRIEEHGTDSRANACSEPGTAAMILSISGREAKLA